MRQYKVVVIGDICVGKSSLLRKARSINEEEIRFYQEYKPTVGVACTYLDCSNGCHLYTLDTSGSPVYKDLVQLYLRRLDAVILVFALNDPISLKNLKEWNETFERVFQGECQAVSKYVLGTKLDVQSLELQEEGLSFADSIGAKFHITSAKTGINVQDFFNHVSEQLLERESLVFESDSDFLEDTCDSGKPFFIEDELMEKSILMKKFPDPMLLDTAEEKVRYLKIEKDGVSLSNEDKTLVWKPSKSSNSYGFVLDDIESQKYKALRQNSLLKCIEFQEPVSIWQHNWLGNFDEVGATIRRQPTETTLQDGIQDFAFCSRNESSMENKNGLFYSILLTEDKNILESGLNFYDNLTSRHDIVRNYFTPTPKKVTLQNETKTSSISLTNGLAAVALADGTVMTLGCSLVGGHFSVDKHNAKDLVFEDFPMPLKLKIEVTQVSCGFDFLLMLSRDGKVFSRGDRKSVCLGNGDSTDTTESTVITSLKDIKSIAAGYHYSLALDQRGSLYSWGTNPSTGKTRTKPKVVSTMSFTTVYSIACGAYHSLCIGEGYYLTGNFRKRSVFSWGLGESGCLGHLNNEDVPKPRLVLEMYNKKGKLIKSVSAGRNHTAFQTDDGMVYTCGSNNNGQLGYFTNCEVNGLPKKVELGKNASGVETRAVRVICSEDCTMITTKEKRVIVWGKFSYGPSIYDPTPLQNTKAEIIDVTTCTLPERNDDGLSCELVIALASSGEVVLCTGVTKSASYDIQDLPWPKKAFISCNVNNMVRIVSVGALIVTLDNNNKCYYADVEQWVKTLIGEELLSSSNDRIMHNICCTMKKIESKNIPTLMFEPLGIPDYIFQIEVSVNSFLFRSDIGDVFCWTPYEGTPVHHHVELDDKIVVQIACGRQHFAALTETGHLFTCGVGCHAQLGHGDIKTRNTFEMVPLCRTERIRSFSCGQASTAVVSTSEKVYFWGQLRVSKEEIKSQEKLLMRSMKTGIDIRPYVLNVSTKSDGSRSYVVNAKQEELILTGRPFEFDIENRTLEGIQMNPNTVFRVQACTRSSNEIIILKGEVNPTQDIFRSTLTFQKEGKYEVSVTSNGNHVSRSPFDVYAELGVPLTTLKMTLVGCNIDGLMSVASVLTNVFGEGKGVSSSLIFPLGVRVQLWGYPPVDAEQNLSDIVALASLSDGGIYVYVWNESFSDFPEQNVSFWLHQIAVKAPFAQVVILGVNMSSGQAHRFDVNKFQRKNPNLTKVIFVASLEEEPEIFIREIQRVVEQRIITEQQRIVWSKLIPMETRIREKINQGVEFISQKEFFCLANECGIEGEARIYESVFHLVKVGLALEVGTEDVFVVISQYWLTRQIFELIRCCPRGAVDVCHLDQPKLSLSHMLIRKKLAFKNGAQTRFFFVPCLATTSDEATKIEEASFVVLRHLVLDCSPYKLNAAFPVLSARVCCEHLETSFHPFSCVIHDELFKCRIDFGPCLINKNKSEIRFTFQSPDENSVVNQAESLVHSMCEYLQKECPHLYIGAQFYISCNHCMRYYFTMEAIQEITVKSKAGAESTLTCKECKGKIVGADLIEGSKMQSTLPKLMESPLDEFIPKSPPERSSSSRQIVPRLVHYINKQEEKILKEMNLHFETMAEFFKDHKEYDVPRTFCLIPIFEGETRMSGDILVNLKRSLLLHQQRKFRLHLLCEGNGDGTGIHFLEPSKHKGYEIQKVNEFVLQYVAQLRNSLQMLMHLIKSLSAVAPLLSPVGSGFLFLTTTSICSVLGIATSKIKEINLNRYFTQIDKFLKEFQDTASSIKQPKHLGPSSTEQVVYKTAGCDFKQLRKVIKDLGKIDKYGGLSLEYCKGIGGVWVCEEHAKYNHTTKALESPKHDPSPLKKNVGL